jgi:hypothetical protein
MKNYFLISYHFLSRIQKNVVANWALTEINKNSKQFKIFRFYLFKMIAASYLPLFL